VESTEDIARQTRASVAAVSDVTKFAVEATEQISKTLQEALKAKKQERKQAEKKVSTKQKAAEKKQELMDIILPSVLGNKVKKRKIVQKRLLQQKKLREAQLKRDIEAAEIDRAMMPKILSKTAPPALRPEVDEDDVRGPYEMNVRPGKHRTPSFAVINPNAAKLRELQVSSKRRATSANWRRESAG